MISIGRVLAGRYQINGFIGEGGMSRVWRALDQNTGKNVAVKVLREEYSEDESFIRRFDREAQAASRMSHPNIVNLLDVGVEDDGTRKRLVLRCYMPRMEQNADTILAIEGGILRECSVGIAIRRVLCSICGADQRTTLCQHAPGRDYDGQRCHMDLDGVADAYEVSLVAVPAQPEAGVIKSKRYGGQEPPPAHDPPGEPGDDSQDWQDEALLELEKYRF